MYLQYHLNIEEVNCNLPENEKKKIINNKIIQLFNIKKEIIYLINIKLYIKLLIKIIVLLLYY